MVYCVVRVSWRCGVVQTCKSYDRYRRATAVRLLWLEATVLAKNAIPSVVSANLLPVRSGVLLLLLLLLLLLKSRTSIMALPSIDEPCLAS